MVNFHRCHCSMSDDFGGSVEKFDLVVVHVEIMQHLFLPLAIPRYYAYILRICIVLYLSPVLNPKSYDGARLYKAPSRPMLVIGRE